MDIVDLRSVGLDCVGPHCCTVLSRQNAPACLPETQRPPRVSAGDVPCPPQVARGVASRGTSLDAKINRVVGWLRQCTLTEVNVGANMAPSVSDAVGAVLNSAKRQTFQQTKVFKHRAQVEAIAAQCVRCMPQTCDFVVELGAGQAVLGHSVSMASGLPLVAIDRRSNVDAFEPNHENAPAAVRVTSDIADDGCWPESGQLALLAKHLCGPGSDLGVDAAIRLAGRLSLLCLAPCCHAKIDWDDLSPESQLWLQQTLGFPGGAEDFALLCDVIRLSRVGAAEAGKPVPCGKWRLRKVLGEAEAEVLGRRACRAIDEIRLARLRAAGLDVAIVEYCDTALTPDNVLILAAPKTKTLPLQRVLATPDKADKNGASCNQCGVLLELDPTAPPSLHQRLVAYLQEQQTHRFPSLRMVLPVADAAAARSPALFCAADSPEHVLSLLTELKACPLVLRVATRPLPHSASASGVQALVDAVVAQRALEAQQNPQIAGAMKVRVSARPRSLEAPVLKALGPSMLSPQNFTHMLCVSMGGAAQHQQGKKQADDVLSNAQLSYSLVQRQLLDWGANSRADDEASRAFWRCFEVATRYPRRTAGVQAAALWTDAPEASTWLERWADLFLPHGAPLVELRLQSSQDGAVGRHVAHSTIRDSSVTPRPAASLLLSDVERACADEVAGQLRALLHDCIGEALATSGVAILRLRCGRQKRSVKKWHRDTARSLEAKLGVCQIELLHLLGDKEPERTAVFAWVGQPGFVREEDLPADGGALTS